MGTYTQDDRLIRVETPLGRDVLLLEAIRGEEGISMPFHYELEMLSLQKTIDTKGMLSKPVAVSLLLANGQERRFHGNIKRISQAESRMDELTAYRAEIAPWFWFLNLFSDSRIFQNKTVPEIVEQVFGDRGYSDYVLRLNGSYPQREYCVQYRETDFNFISRLLEEEGIFYFFEHTDQKHTLVLADANSAICPAEHQSEVRYGPAMGHWQDEDVVKSIESVHQVHTGKVSLNDYDFEKPNSSIDASLNGQQKGEFYDYPGRYKTRNEGSRYARVRLEALEVEFAKVRGESNLRTLASGYRIKLLDHYRSDLNQNYSIIRAWHEARTNSYRPGGKPEHIDYKNTFECVPHETPYRPPQVARKPVVQGSQTAVVVGKSGEEIWTDKYGRVKVQFFWDREGRKDENSSCWVRVAQMWAGKQWGAIFTPRIGHEVIVDFLEGDPDQPIITGRVYNADHMPPYTLPSDQTISTIKTLSSKDGEGFNEIRFEDKKGSEQIFIHAEKDYDMRVENDRKEWIGRDRHLIVERDKLEKVDRDNHITITRDQVEKVGRDHHLEVAGKEALKVTGSHSLTVQGNVIEVFQSGHSEVVTQNYYLKAANVVIEATTGLTIKVGGNFVSINSGGVQIKGNMVLINSGGAALSGNAGSAVSPVAPTAAQEADEANPGEVGDAGQANTTTPGQNPLSSITASQRRSGGGAGGAAGAVAAMKMVAASDAPPHDPTSEENQEKKSFIEIKLVGEDGKPIPGEPYRITLPDGKVADGTLDENGYAKVENIDPGSCKITFPNLDKDAWEAL
ncbi:MAG: type VI secretion system Vgr family protein [Bryobacteraceae bacterium]